MKKLMLTAAAVALALSGCATPGELKRAVAAPTMAQPTQANPLPNYAVPDSHP